MKNEIKEHVDKMYKEFKFDFESNDNEKFEKWNLLFDNFQNSETPNQQIFAIGGIFRLGAYTIKDKDRFEKFRSMYHKLYDMILVELEE